MRRSLMSLLVAGVLVLSCVPWAGAAKLSSNNAQAYVDVLQDIKATGVLSLDSYLVDFDGEGRDELLVIWKPKDAKNTHYEVWSGTKKLTSSVAVQGDFPADLKLTDLGGKRYLISQWVVLGDVDVTMYTVDNGKWVQQDDLHCQWIVTGNDGPDEGYYACTVNGSQANYETFEQRYEPYLLDSVWIHSDVERYPHSVEQELWNQIHSDISRPDHLSELPGEETGLLPNLSGARQDGTARLQFAQIAVYLTGQAIETTLAFAGIPAGQLNREVLETML